MDHVIYLFAPMAFLAAVLASISIWSRRALWIKVVALATTMLLIPTAYAGILDLLSKPKPVHLEWIVGSVEEAMVLSAAIWEGEAIYLWLKIDGVGEPRYYVLPWDLGLAEELQEALREAARNRSGVLMRLPFEPSWARDDPTFYALPQPALPPKFVDPNDPGPLLYIHPEIES